MRRESLIAVFWATGGSGAGPADAADTPLFPEPRGAAVRSPAAARPGRSEVGKSRANAIGLRDDEDRTAALVRQARTDGERTIAYEPHRRPEVANLLGLAALCTDGTPDQMAEEIGDAGAGRLKALVTEAINEHLQPLRRRRTELAADPGHLLDVLVEGNAVA